MLVKDKTTLELFLPINKDFSYSRILSFITSAENDLIKIIGQAFYTELDTYAGTDTVILNLIKKLQNSICYTSYFLGFDILNTVFSNQGHHRIDNEDSGKKSLFQRQEIELKNTFKRQGQNKLDGALAYLETNKAAFGTWTGSPEYTLLRANFINSTLEFNKHFFINNSRLVFLKLRPYQTLAEDFEVISVIGRAYFDELKTQIAADNLTAENIAFMLRLVKAVAPLTIYHGGFSLMADMNEFGLFKIESGVNAKNFKKDTQIDFFDRIIENSKRDGDAYMKNCEAFLKANITDYATYAGSDVYDADAGAYDMPEGTDKIVII